LTGFGRDQAVKRFVTGASGYSKGQVFYCQHTLIFSLMDPFMVNFKGK
jgi:hypothetical protein